MTFLFSILSRFAKYIVILLLFISLAFWTSKIIEAFQIISSSDFNYKFMIKACLIAYALHIILAIIALLVIAKKGILISLCLGGLIILAEGFLFSLLISLPYKAPSKLPYKNIAEAVLIVIDHDYDREAFNIEYETIELEEKSEIERILFSLCLFIVMFYITNAIILFYLTKTIRIYLT